MAAIAKSGVPSLSSMGLQPGAQKLPALIVGEDIAGGDACYVKSDGKVWKSTGALTGLNPPDEPALVAALSGGTIVDGLYGVKISYINATGETPPSEAMFIRCASTTPDQSTITVSKPAASGSGGAAATHYRVYMTPKNGGPFKLQNGAGTLLANDFTLTAPPATNTTEPLTSDTSGSKAASKVHGFAPTEAKTGEPISLIHNVNMNYGASLTPGTNVYLSGATAGALADTPSALGIEPIGFVVDASRIHLHQSRY